MIVSSMHRSTVPKDYLSSIQCWTIISLPDQGRTNPHSACVIRRLSWSNKGHHNACLYAPVNNFQLCWDRSSSIEPVLKQGQMCLAQGHYTVRRITENHTFTENHRKPLRKSSLYGNYALLVFVFLVVYVYIHIIYDILLQGIW